MKRGGIFIAPGVELRGVQPQTIHAIHEGGDVFADEGFALWVTSVMRPDPRTLHGFGYSFDGDASTELPQEVGVRVQNNLRQRLGPQYYVVWHRTDNGQWHIHCEFDPGNKGVEPHLDIYDAVWAWKTEVMSA